MTVSIRNFGLGPRIGLDIERRVKDAEQVEAELVEKVKKLDDREQEKLTERVKER